MFEEIWQNYWAESPQSLQWVLTPSLIVTALPQPEGCQAAP
jgi:hypothetical protein